MVSPAKSGFDAHMMAIALRMAKRGLGSTAPNPSVGAVIVDEKTGEVIARGWTQPGGRPHAEKEALRRAGDRARGATMYVTLEPCAHTGRIPTCADSVLAAGIARLVCALPDPNPVISGRGLADLAAAGVRVETGLMADEASAMTAGHILRRTMSRPFVQLKLAVSADGRVAPGDGRAVWVTGPEARARAHLLRAEADAILVGIKTVLADDPELTCRLPGLGQRSPDRVIVDNKLRTPLTARVLAKDRAARRIWIATCLAVDERLDRDELPEGATILTGLGTGAPDDPKNRVDLGALFEVLAGNGITRLLVEGGPTIARDVLSEDLADEIVLFRGAASLGKEGFEPFDASTWATLDDPSQWMRGHSTPAGPDTVTTWRRVRARS
jgi:diaminohydroxyphosphoribosylaminopyrimidine deaminase / 5-amino-6-(5-phosphoribosylamino)uracil reductase